MKHGRATTARGLPAAQGWRIAPPAAPLRTGPGARLRYRFDSVLSRGPWMLVVWLALASTAFLVVAAAVVAAFGLGINGGKPVGFGEAFWQDMLRLLDTGTMAGDNGWALRVVSLVVTVTGIFVATSLIGLIATSLDQRIASLRRGRSQVLEEGHTLVLGWSARVFAVLAELVEANRNQRRSAIVVLAPEDKTTMEDRIRARIGPTGSTKIICRTGEPSNLGDLERVNVGAARDIVVLAGDAVDGDAAAVKAVLAVTTTDTGLAPRSRIVTEMLDEHTARALDLATDGAVMAVQSDDVIAKVTAQACHFPGLSVVYRELLDFAGDEIYFAAAPELAGHTFAEALLAYDTSAVIGRAAADGTIELVPPMDRRFEPGDSVIAISEDDDTVVFTGFGDDAPVTTAPVAGSPPRSSRMLVVGWSSLGGRILRELDGLLSERTPVDVVVDETLIDPATLHDRGCTRLALEFHTTPDEPERVHELVADGEYEHVVVLGYRDGLSVAQADARTLLTLLTLRRLYGAAEQAPRVVAEVLDSRDAPLADTAGADDLVVSDRLGSLMIAQLAERPERKPVFDELFAPTGALVATRPAADYVSPASSPFAAVVAAGRDAGDAVIGYRRASGDVVLNPPKNDPVTLGADDRVVVVTRS